MDTRPSDSRRFPRCPAALLLAVSPGAGKQEPLAILRDKRSPARIQESKRRKWETNVTRPPERRSFRASPPRRSDRARILRRSRPVSQPRVEPEAVPDPIAPGRELVSIAIR